MSLCVFAGTGLYMRQGGSAWIFQGIYLEREKGEKYCTFEILLIDDYYESIKTIIDSEIASKEISLKCQFGIGTACFIDNLEDVNEPNVLAVAVNVLGDHLENYSNEGVTHFIILSGNSSHLPNGIGNIFENLENFWITGGETKVLDRTVFQNMNHLKVFRIQFVPLEEISGDTFSDLTDLRSLMIFHTKLKKLDVKLLANLKRLVSFDCDVNQIEQIQEDLFKHNLFVTRISLSNNKIKKVFANFDNLLNLKYLDLNDNLCIDGCCNPKWKIKCEEKENSSEN